MRELTSHKVNGLNEAITIKVIDEPGQGNACHAYDLLIPSPQEGRSFSGTTIRFQNGPIGEVGVNGVSNEALLAVVRDRLEGFQSGPFSCDTNQQALEYVCEAMDALHSRTRERVARGVEGTHTV